MEYQCPKCGNKEILISSKTSYKMNSGEFFCHSIKTHDSYAEVSCLDCGYEGTRKEVEDKNPVFIINWAIDTSKVKSGDKISLQNGNEFIAEEVNRFKETDESIISMIDEEGFRVEFTFFHLKGATVHRKES